MDRKKIKSKKSRKSSISRNPSIVGDAKSFSNQLITRMVLPGTPQQLFPSVSGIIQLSGYMGTGDITTFASRFGGTFQQYRILGVDCKVLALGGFNGASVMWFDEFSSAVPTFANASIRNSWLVPNTSNNPQSNRVFKWRARNLEDLAYTAIGSVYNPVYFKVYTDNTTYSTDLSMGHAIWLLQPWYIIEFKSLT